MEKQLNDKQTTELSHINEWCLTIIDFMIVKYGETPGLLMIKDPIKEAYLSQNLKGMRCVLNDINEWAKGLPLSDINELNILLQNKFGEDLQTVTKQHQIKIAQILKKGKISNENEYRLVLGHVDEIYNDSSKKNVVDSLNKLLVEYHKLTEG